MCERDLKTIQTLIDKPHGMIVVTGPTGSGKSTTMYALLSKLNSVSRNIVTVEDPVEYRLPGINQVASDNEHGLGFANALKYIMRQDPDVIMVGEIRDHETAATAVQAALTGHLLISTLHANDAVGADRPAQRPGRRQLQDRRRTAGLDRPAACCGRSARDCKEPVEPNEHYFEALVQRSPSRRTTRCSTAAAAARSASAPATRAACRSTRSWSSRRRWPKAIENGLPRTKLRADRHSPKAWSNWPPPAWSRCSPAARRWKKCSTNSRANESVRVSSIDNDDTTTTMRRARKQSMANAAAIAVGDARGQAAHAPAGNGWRLKFARPQGAGQAEAERPRPGLHPAEPLDAHRQAACRCPKRSARSPRNRRSKSTATCCTRFAATWKTARRSAPRSPHFGDSFDTVMVNQIKVGEHSGTLGETLTTIARHREDGNRLRSEIIRKLAYPIMLVVMGTRSSRSC